MAQVSPEDVGASFPPGEFPFPLPRAHGESPYLTWLRNHSNYMATRGVLDYLRAAGVLVRGVLINFLILLSFLLTISLLIGHLYRTELRPWGELDEQALLLDLTARAARHELGVQWLYELSPRIQEAATTYWLSRNERSEDEDVAAQVELQHVIGEELETLLQDPMLAQRIGDAELSEETQRLLVQNPQGPDLRRLNGLILRDLHTPDSWLDALDVWLDSPRSAQASLWAWLRLPSMPEPFTLTRVVVVLSLLWVVFSPIWTVFGEVAGQKKSAQRAGSDSSVKRRDQFERKFGFALLLIFAAAVFEALPVLVGYLHDFRTSQREIDWNAIFAVVAGASVATMGAAQRLISALGGLRRRLAMLVIGLLGVLTPLLIILYVTDFLVYHEPYDGWLNFLLLGLLPVAYALLILAVIGVGVLRRSFRFRELLRLLLLFVAVVSGTVLIGAFLLGYVLEEESSFREWNFYCVALLALELWLFCRLVVDVNRTSIHGLYRDRLATAYLVGRDTEGDVAIEEDVNLSEIADHEEDSIAPYHLVNATLNLQGSRDPSIRDRASDFFVFSKRFIGGHRTGYCRTETMEEVHPSMNLATAMAISAAAASPNMGRATSPALVAFMVLLNIRLGYWLPNPGLLEEKLFGRWLKQIPGLREERGKTPPGFTFREVFELELVEVQKRWRNLYGDRLEHSLRKLHFADDHSNAIPTTRHGLVGLGFSGGGIRSATINLGIAQVLHERGIFEHVDYMSTVSGGGYLGSSLSTLMRSKTEIPGKPGKLRVRSKARKHHSEVRGVATVGKNDLGEQVVLIQPKGGASEEREYRFAKFDPVVVKTGDKIKPEQLLIERHSSLWDRFRWRVRPSALVREMMMRLDERHRWVNLSDGGHIENLAGIELLRRRCKFIVLGDGEADGQLHFSGLATLLRYARIDLGIEIDIHPHGIRLDPSRDAADRGVDRLSSEHWAAGTIWYPENEEEGLEREEGYLLYLKSSFSGDEDEVIQEYRHRNPDFPHQSTADQFFDEDQFECYRALGQHIAEMALQEMTDAEPVTFADLARGMAALAKRGRSDGESPDAANAGAVAAG